MKTVKKEIPLIIKNEADLQKQACLFRRFQAVPEIGQQWRVTPAYDNNGYMRHVLLSERAGGSQDPFTTFRVGELVVQQEQHPVPLVVDVLNNSYSPDTFFWRGADGGNIDIVAKVLRSEIEFNALSYLRAFGVELLNNDAPPHMYLRIGVSEPCTAVIDWGDQPETVVLNAGTNNIYHQYPETGMYRMDVDVDAALVTDLAFYGDVRSVMMYTIGANLENLSDLRLTGNKIVGYAAGMLPWQNPNLTQIQLGQNEMDSIALQELVQDAVDSGYEGYRLLNIQNQTNGACNEATVALIAILEGRGWTVFYDIEPSDAF